MSVDERCNGGNDCIGGEDELEHNCPCNPEERIRLVGGVVLHRGRMEICKNTRWLAVCVSSWSNREAQVACHQLGYPRLGILYIILFCTL